MHLQIRSDPSASPPDVEKFLRRLKDAGVNLAGVGGGNVEGGGLIAIAPDHKDEAKAIKALQEDPAYTFTVVDSEKDPRLTLCWLKNEPGELHKCIAEVTKENRKSGRVIRDLLIGVPTEKGIPVQVYSD